MSGLNVYRLLVVVGLLGAPISFAANAPQPQPVTTRLPNWAGLWETEAAAKLLQTGKFGETALQTRPPYNAAWEQKLPPVPLTPPGRTDPLPPDAKICAPEGFPAAMGQPVPDAIFEFLVTPEQTLFVTSDRTIRHIYTDGRRHPVGPDLWPTVEGHSIGLWEGQTLVVDTVARTAGPVTNVPGSANLSPNAHFWERIRLTDPDTLINDMTIEDPERLSRPWKFSIRYKRVKDMNRMVPVDCHENDRNSVVNGSFVIAPPK